MSTPAALNHTFIKHEDSPVILYLHGFLGGGEDWGDVIERLGNCYCHLTVDLPGHGRSVANIPEESYTMAGCAELVIGLLDRLEIERCHLIAYSMGGRLSLFLLSHYPGRFDRAVIESASPGLKTDEERAARREHDARIAKRLTNQPLERFLAEWYDQPLFASLDRSDPRFEALLKRRRELDPIGLALSLKHLGTGAQPSLWPRLPELNRPALFMVGERDVKFRAIADDMANLCPGAATAIIPGAGHNVHFERPAIYCEEITRFLSQNE